MDLLHRPDSIQCTDYITNEYIVLSNYHLRLWSSSLPPANEVCEGYVFTGVCLSIWGDMHGWGACVAGRMCVAGGACMAGGMHSGGCAWLGVCMVRGAMHGWGHACPPADTTDMAYGQ